MESTIALDCHKQDPKQEIVALPVTAEALDAFVLDIVNLFGLPNTDDTYESICTLIIHMPQSTCRAPKSFFGDSVLKSMTNAAAFAKLQEFSRKRRSEPANIPVEASSEPVQDKAV